MIDADLRARIRRLFFAEHWKRGTIAAQLGVHFDTVVLALGLKGSPSPRKGKLGKSAVDPYVPFIRDTLKQYPSLVATRLTEMIRERGYKGSAVQVRRRIRQLDLRPRQKQEAYFRLNVLPGEYGQADWGHFGRFPVEGGERRLYAYVMTLSWSRAVYVEFFTDDKLESFFSGFVHAVEAFGGSPRVVLVDNLKSVVLERVGDLIHFHPRALELFGHYMTWGQPCAVARGNEKGRVERTIRYLRTSFWPARRFTDLDDLNRQAAAWVEAVAHQRVVPGGYRYSSLLTPAIQSVLKEMGIKRRLTVHGLRRTLNNLLRQAETDIIVVQACTGHSSDRMTSHYSHVADEEKHRALDKVFEKLGSGLSEAAHGEKSGVPGGVQDA